MVLKGVGRVPVKTIGRLSLYRRLLSGLVADGARSVYSHELAALAGSSAAQVRRDLMAVGYSGSPNRGYQVLELMNSIGEFLDSPSGQRVGLVGVGNLGRALLSYFTGRRPKLAIAAAFDIDPDKLDRVIDGCRCHALDDLDAVVRELSIGVGIITVPAQAAQDVGDRMVAAGIRGILNFAPVRLHVPENIYVEDLDMTTSLEKAAYFARQYAEGAREPHA